MKFSQSGTLLSNFLLATSTSLVAGIATPVCNADNCLRALRATTVPGRLEESQEFCADFTATRQTEPSAVTKAYAQKACTRHIGIVAQVSSACACLPSSTALPHVSSEALQKEITPDGLIGNLVELDKIAKANGGNRAFGLPGYAASVDFVLSETAYSTSWNVTTQDFPGLYNQVESISFVVDGVNYYIYGLTYSPSTSEEGLTLPLVLGATGDVGCTAEGYSNIDVKGKIVLVERGTCPDGTTLAGRVKPAAAAGASAVIIYSNIATNVTAGTLSAPNPAAYVPSGYINQVDGRALVARLTAGEALTAFFQQTQNIETRITKNIFAESTEGDSENVIMLGAHLDSVQAGAGINDDGSGSTLLLEMFHGLQKFKTKNKIRLAWWGAEENGLVGSRYYVGNLAQKDIDSLLVYLNFDMVSRGYFGVFDGDGSTFNRTAPAGSDVIEKLFVDDLTSKGITTTSVPFSGGSDYVAFLEVLGKPVGGLFTGTGIEQDPCYHQPCDTLENANSTVLTINAKTAAHVLSLLAQDGTELIPKTPSTGPNGLKVRDQYTGSFIREALAYPWTVTEEEEGFAKTCHEIV